MLRYIYNLKLLVWTKEIWKGICGSFPKQMKGNRKKKGFNTDKNIQMYSYTGINYNW